MSDLRNSSAKTKACFDASEFDFETLPKLPQASLPDVFGEGLVLSNSETGSPAESDRDSKVRKLQEIFVNKILFQTI